MEHIRLLFLMISCLGSSCSALANNSTISKIEFDFSAEGGDESESELSSQLQEINDRSKGWSQWYSWSACSRSCDGGISHQFRTCESGPCRGSDVRYQICNMQPCPINSLPFREEQCVNYNIIPYEGSFYDWFPFYDDLKPCSLICKGRLRGTDDELVIVKFKDKVQDGTRCRPGSLDMCINGKCQKVGCDLRLGSEKQVDECGVCGGDGSSCANHLYHWTSHTSACSVSCGGGYRTSRPICKNRSTGDEVEDDLCSYSQKPDSTMVGCNPQMCPPTWHVSEWGKCSSACGEGVRYRQVFCIEAMNNSKIQIDDSKCEGNKPWFQEECNESDCPIWTTSKWSGCSVSCGEGIQNRIVECRNSRDQPSEICDINIKPQTTQPCSTGISCSEYRENSEHFAEPIEDEDDDQIYVLPPDPEKLVGDQIVPSESTYIPDEWGPCSVTCGEGIRKREVHCKIFLEFSRTIAKLPDKKCTGVKPYEVEKCFKDPCPYDKIGIDVKDDPANIKVGSGSPAKSYSWKEQGFTHCSASCLGGVQELIVNCVRDDTEKVTSPFMCPIELKPEIILRACNEHSCPPRWAYSEFSPCSQSCGIGIQTRDVNCIHELTQGGSNTVTVPNNRCPQPPPPDRQYCNVLDCPVRWKISDWSKCSQPCGGGEKTRKVECKQVMAQNHTVDRPNMCPNPKPLERKPCNTKSCAFEVDRPDISVTNTTFKQTDPKKNKVTVKIGGAAILFTGTTVKIKCPVKRFDRSKIIWKKDNAVLEQNKKYKNSKKGALRVQNLTLRDMGTYSCVAGKSSASISISVRPKPGQFATSEEVLRQYQMDLIPNESVLKPSDGKAVYVDDQSHEQKPDTSKKKHYKMFTPTASSSSSLTLDGYVLSTATKSQDKMSNLPSSSSELPNTPNYGDSRSSASRIMPNFLSLISKIQALWPSFALPNKRRIESTLIWNEMPELRTDQLVSNPINKISHRHHVSGKRKGRRKQMIAWKTFNCSGSASCVVMLTTSTRIVDDVICQNAAIPLPNLPSECDCRKVEECPSWAVSEWGQCDTSTCFALHQAMQTRKIKCQISGNFTAKDNKCNPHEKPIDQRPCYQVNCVERWKSTSWSYDVFPQPKLDMGLRRYHGH